MKSEAKSWFDLSKGAKKFLGIEDSTSDTGFLFNTKKSVALSGVLGAYDLCGHISTIDRMIEKDIDFINKHKNEVPLEKIYKYTGFYPDRVEYFLSVSPENKKITENEWKLIYEQYQIRFDKKLAELHNTEMSAQLIAEASLSHARKTLKTHDARKELSMSPEKKWDKEYSEAS